MHQGITPQSPEKWEKLKEPPLVQTGRATQCNISKMRSILKRNTVVKSKLRCAPEDDELLMNY